MTIMERLRACGIVPVIVMDDAEKAVPVAKALLAGGIDVMEITFRTSAARASIEAVSKEVPEMLVGAGTIVTAEQLEQATGAGAEFIVSPGTDAELIAGAIKKDVPILPGAVTPSELMVGLKLGLTVFKFFPAADYGGLKTIKSLGGPFPNARFVPTGGISEKNAADYFADSRIFAIGGSWMASPDMIRDEKYAEITGKTAEAVALMKAVRDIATRSH